MQPVRRLEPRQCGLPVAPLGMDLRIIVRAPVAERALEARELRVRLGGMAELVGGDRETLRLFPALRRRTGIVRSFRIPEREPDEG